MFEEMKKVNDDNLSLEEFEEIIKSPGFDLEGYIISKKITAEQEKELVYRLGEDWKKNLWWKYQRFLIVGDWGEEWNKAIKKVEEDFLGTNHK